MNLKKTLLILAIIPLLSFSVHKYYLSLTQVKYKSESKSIQIIINVFMDDIETALNKDYNIDLRLTSKKELKNNDVYFEKYLRDKLKFTVNNQVKEFNYIGKEYEDDLVYFYLEIEEINEISKIDISNKLLIKHFPEQQNLIKTKINDKNKSFLLSKDETIATLTY